MVFEHHYLSSACESGYVSLFSYFMPFCYFPLTLASLSPFPLLACFVFYSSTLPFNEHLFSSFFHVFVLTTSVLKVKGALN